MTFTLLPAVFLLVMAGKAWGLAAIVLPDDFTRGFFSALAADIPSLAAIVLLELFTGWLKTQRGWAVPLRILCRMSAYLLLAVFSLHAAAILAIDEIITIDSIKKFAVEGKALLEFFDPLKAAGVALLFALTFVRVNLPRRWSAAAVICTVLLTAAYVRAAPLLPEQFLTYSFKPQDVVRTEHPRTFGTKDREWYSKKDVEYFRRRGSLSPEITFVSGTPNILFLIVESLSTVDSFRLSGLKDTLPNFDRVSKDGLLFSRFFANTRQSEGAQVAVFSGYSPLPFPGSSSDWYGSFQKLSPVVPYLKQEGYHLESLSTFESGFLNNGAYVQGLGFDHVRGRDETKAFDKVPKFAFGTPADAALYQEVLRTITELNQSGRPFFFTAYTGSSHLPWTAPQGKPNTEPRVWNYVDEQFGRFYDSLKQSGFFENGVLIVTGDHRKRVPRSIEEIDKYGEMSRALVPLLIVGKGFPAGKIDNRFFQQADLLTKFGKILDPQAELSPVIFFLDDPPESYLLYEESEGGRISHRFKLPSNGSEIVWDDAPPKDKETVEALIHTQRALNQARRLAEQ